MSAPSRRARAVLLTLSLLGSGVLHAQTPATQDGFALLQLHSCASCHALPDGIEATPVAAPDLTNVGSRLSPGWMRAWLADPHTLRPGTRMPGIAPGPDGRIDQQLVEDLVHHLQSRSGPFETREHTLLSSEITRGAKLYEEIGCRACHTPNALVNQAWSKGYDLDGLAEMLHEPHRVHPSGRMPALLNDRAEARAIAAWMLSEQVTTTLEQARKPGLKVTVKAGEFPANDAALSGGRIVSEGVAPRPTIDVTDLKDLFGLIFEGEITIEEEGEYVFFLSSDDGSWLDIDGRRVIDHGGVHPPSTKEGVVQLSQGRHAFRLAMFERTGGESLKLEWEGPEHDRELVPAEVFSFSEVTLRGPATDGFAVDAESAARGAKHYEELGCASCHEPQRDAKLIAGPLTASFAGGCPEPGQDHTGPTARLEPKQIEAIRQALATPPPSDAKLAAARRIETRIETLNCRACHERDGVGGPDPARDLFFRGTADLGDSGRIPPSLTGIGGKLKTSWIDQVLVHDRRVRPYMVTRMPRYGDIMKGLAQEFRVVDGKPGDDVEPEWSTEIAEAGRTLIGRQGFSCINCHFFDGVGQAAYHAVDLALAHERLLPSWQRKILENPGASIPGTRMVQFYDGENVPFPNILGGDKDRQIDAMRAYLNRFTRGSPLPHGTDFDRSRYDLKPVDGPIVAGVFMRGLSARVVAVGDPTGLHLAFDRKNSRLARLWRGSFLNVEGTWHNRAGKLEVPDSMDVKSLPAGSSVGWLENPDAPWEDTPLQSLGEERLDDGRPVFLWGFEGHEVTETIKPFVKDGRRGFSRRLLIRQTDRQSEYDVPRARVLVGKSLTERDGRWVSDDGLEVEIVGGTVESLWADRARSTGELIVTAPTGDDMFVHDIEVIYSW